MDFQRLFKNGSRLGRDTQGIALFMVLASVGILSILVTDFVYITQVSQAVAYGGLDQAQAHYLAKSGLKLSLLRLKAYLNIQKFVGNMEKAMPGANSLVPKSLVEKVWSFPFFYPIPTDVPGITPADRDLLKKFQKEVGIDGTFSATIESESAKYNLNSIVPGFGPAPAPSNPPSPGGQPGNQTGQPSPVTDPSQAAAQAREGLAETLNLILTQKAESDPDFLATYRDLRIPELVDQIAAWTDRRYDRQSSPSRDLIPMKRAPFYSVSELHNLSTLDEDLYQVFAPHFTSSLTSAININMMREGVLRTLAPKITAQEVDAFFKFRDSDSADNYFKTGDDFYGYLLKSVSAYREKPKLVDELKDALKKRQVQLITDERLFKITVQATVNSATRTLQAWVTLAEPQAPAPPVNGVPAAPPDSGITITSMKID